MITQKIAKIEQDIEKHRKTHAIKGNTCNNIFGFCEKSLILKAKLDTLKEIQSEIKKVIDEMKIEIKENSKYDNEVEQDIHFGMSDSLDEIEEKLGI